MWKGSEKTKQKFARLRTQYWKVNRNYNFNMHANTFFPNGITIILPSLLFVTKQDSIFLLTATIPHRQADIMGAVGSYVGQTKKKTHHAYAC